MLRWYPADIARYVLAAAWQRLSQEMPMICRTAERSGESAGGPRPHIDQAVLQALLADITETAVGGDAGVLAR